MPGRAGRIAQHREYVAEIVVRAGVGGVESQRAFQPLAGLGGPAAQREDNSGAVEGVDVVRVSAEDERIVLHRLVELAEVGEGVR